MCSQGPLRILSYFTMWLLKYNLYKRYANNDKRTSTFKFILTLANRSDYTVVLVLMKNKHFFLIITIIKHMLKN